MPTGGAKDLDDTHAPVNLVRDGGPDYMGGGLAGARAVTVPLDRQTLLWLDLPGDRRPLGDRDLEPTTFLAIAHNTSAVIGAERFVYFHPADDPVPPEVVPRPSPARLETSGGDDLVNRDRPLGDVLEQNAKRTRDGEDASIADYAWPIAGYRQREA